jgi:ferric iron reductase protein FhuF
MRRVEGEPARVILDGALATVAGLVPYLTARTEPTRTEPTRTEPTRPPPTAAAAPDRPVPPDGDWMSGQDLIDDPRWLARVISSTGSGLGTDDPVVAASVFVQGYSYRVLTLTVACLTAAGVVPDASAPHVDVALSRHWPSVVAFTGAPVLVLDGPDDISALPADSDTITVALRFVVHQTIDRHLAPLLDAVHSGMGVPLGARLLWGNVAASAATAFRTMEGCQGRFVEPLAHRFFALAPPEVQGLGSFATVEHAGRRAWFWERTSCCLFDRLPDGIRCADCSRTPPARRAEDYRASLEPSEATDGGRQTGR